MNPAFTFLAIQTDFCLNGITLIQYRDTLLDRKVEISQITKDESFLDICVTVLLAIRYVKLYQRIYFFIDILLFDAPKIPQKAKIV